MFKRLLSAALIVCTSVAAFAQSSSPFQLVSQSATQAVVKVTPSAPVFKAVQTPQGTQYVVTLEQGTAILKKDYPDLQKLTTSLACPDGMVWAVTSVEPGAFTDYNKSIAPSKGNIYRNVDKTTLPFSYAPIYSQNEFFPSQLAFLRDPYILRDYAGQALVVNPLQYNAATQTVRCYNELIVTLKAIPDASGMMSQIKTDKPVVSEFSKAYKHHFLNYSTASQARYTPLDEQGDMLVICFDSFMPVMQPFVDWKNQKGLRTEMVAKSTVGTTAAAIKTYITNYYNTHNLAYVLLVGDAAQIPASSTSSGDSDINYGFMSGNDSYPEIFVGRFSGTTAASIQVQVEKSIQYEKQPDTGANGEWYNRAITVASSEGPGDDDQYDYEHGQIISEQLLTYNYDQVSEMYEGSQGGADAAGDPPTEDLVDAINDGASVFNYTGHGNITLIATTSFTNNDVADLTNVGKWPFIWIVGCQTGNFVPNTCFAEVLARATTPAGHTGAVVSMMATINQSWDPPMEAQDEFNAILTESDVNNIKRSFGGISFNGCMQMNDEYGNQGDEMTDTWILFGDPSLAIRTDVATPLTVTHSTVEPLGLSSLQITCNTNGALACLTNNGVILSVATVAGGVATFTFDPIMAVDTLLVTVTAYNKVPYFGNVQILPANGPYVITDSYAVQDPTGNNNNLADYNENVIIGVSLKNIGNASADNVMATISTSNPYVTLTDANETYGSIASNTLMPAPLAFGVQVSNLIPDGEVVPFTVTATDDNGNTWQTSVTITLHAPILDVTSFTVNDASGNNNGKLDPGETVSLALVTNNNGSSNTITGQGILSTASTQVSVTNGPLSGAPIVVAGNNSQAFNVVVSPTASYYSFVTFDYSYDAGGYTATKSFSLKVGNASEDFETNDFSKFQWQLSGAAEWFTTTTSPFDGSYCSQSGDIADNDSTVLSVEVISLVDDSIKFARRTSSEAGYDFLSFYIGATRMTQWSGGLGWSTFTYPVSAGTHTFRWTYRKDNYYSTGTDAAWVDDIVLPFNTIASAIFENETVNGDASVYPNPASAQTTVWYSIGEASDVSVDVYNMLGQNVTTLQNMEYKQAGSYSLQLNTTDLAAGQYIVNFRVNGATYSRKLDVIK